MIDIISEYGDKIGAALVALVGVLGSRYVWGRISLAWARTLAQRAYGELTDAVLEVWQTYVSELTKGRADGTLTADEKAEAKRRAIAIAKANLGPKGLARLARALGFGSLFGGDPAKADGWLGSKVETAVATLKRAGYMTKGLAPSAALASSSSAAPSPAVTTDPQ